MKLITYINRTYSYKTGLDKGDRAFKILMNKQTALEYFGKSEFGTLEELLENVSEFGTTVNKNALTDTFGVRTQYLKHVKNIKQPGYKVLFNGNLSELKDHFAEYLI